MRVGAVIVLLIACAAVSNAVSVLRRMHDRVGARDGVLDASDSTVEVGGGAYKAQYKHPSFDEKVHPVVCNHMKTWLTTNAAGAAAPSKTHDEIVQGWHSKWSKESDDARSHVPVDAALPIARTLVRTVRFRHAHRPIDHVCDTEPINVGLRANAAAPGGAAARALPTYTLGIEWELHAYQVAPAVDGVGTFCESAYMPAPLEHVPYLRWSVDHALHNALELRTVLDTKPIQQTIVEVNLGAFPLSPNDDSAGGATAQSLAKIAAVMGNTHTTILALSKQKDELPVLAPRAGNGGYGFAKMAEVIAALDVANNAHAALGANFRMTPADEKALIKASEDRKDAVPYLGSNGYKVRARLREADELGKDDAEAKMRARTFLQANYLMPVSAIASADWLTKHYGYKRVASSKLAWNVALLSRIAAARYLTEPNYFPTALMTSLTPTQRADLYGTFQVFYGHIIYHFFSDPNYGYLERVKLPVTSTPKNIFFHMIKTNTHQILQSFEPELADVVYDWFMGKQFHEGDYKLNQNLRNLFRNLRYVFKNYEDRPVLKDIALEWELSKTDRKFRFYKILFDKLYAFHPVCDIDSENCLTSPLAARAPGVARVNGVLSAVVESREERNPLNVAVLSGSAAAVNAATKGFLKQHEWDGTNSILTKFKNNVATPQA